MAAHAHTLANVPMTGPEATEAALEVLEGLETLVGTASFLHKLELAREEWVAATTEAGPLLAQASALHPHAPPPLPSAALDPATTAAALQGTLPPPSGAEVAQHAGAAPAGQTGTGHAEANAEGFIVVDKEDAVEAMAYYIAVYLTRMPEAQRMSPQQLQSALQGAMHQMHKSHFRMVIDYGRYIYRFSAIGYSAIQLYENPWVVRAVATAVWASGKLAWGALGMLL